MAILIASVLTAVVRYTEGPNGRRKCLTEVMVKAGPLEVASKTLSGRYSQRQALMEFKRNSKSWAIHNKGAARMPIAA